ncbi:MAG: phosphoethanolamine--lipid A transferase [Betaproteobacteria bacterium]|nr:phosphoethanolamine--lipid A transferase [Betaproteobacteria bacterium]
MRFRLPAQGLTGNTLIVMVAVFLTVSGNLTFFGKVLATYQFTAGNAPELISLAVMVTAISVLLLALTCFGRTTRPVLIVILLLSSLAACFMDSYGIIINTEMLENVAQTNVAEALDLLNFRLLAYFVLLGVIPAVAVARVPLHWRGMRVEALARGKLLALIVVLMVGTVLAFGGFYASFIRQHKSLRFFTNPATYIYSTARFAGGAFAAKGGQPVAVIGHDAHILPHDATHRELFILVIGETARADRFSLNGYERDTNPQLRRAGVVNFPNFWACGTSTAVSVPCMFSLIGIDKFDTKAAAAQENVLDVLQRAGVNVLWLDNNSDSKDVALRVPYKSYKTPDVNPVCDPECRDVGMLPAVQEYIEAHPTGDILIVLHQMGNHGPAYFKRYPPEFEKFRPACQNADLSQCSREEIGNAYDNAILYTDFFLGKVIELLQRNEGQFETAMLYMSDHGESLGEKGVYLHGLPRAIAPEAQLHVPAVMWFGGGYDQVDVAALRKKSDTRFTHDNLAHTILGFLEVRTSVYRPTMDILDGCRKPGR